jgi:hypothetical protein
MAPLAEMIEAGDVDALHRWLSGAGTLDTADELARLDPEDKASPSGSRAHIWFPKRGRRTDDREASAARGQPPAGDPAPRRAQLGGAEVPNPLRPFKGPGRWWVPPP